MLENLTAVNAENVTIGDDVVYDPPFKMLLIIPDGVAHVITIQNEREENVALTVEDSVSGAIYLPGRVRRIMDTGTDINPSQIIGIR